jgi:hypothetical protein
VGHNQGMLPLLRAGHRRSPAWPAAVLGCILASGCGYPSYYPVAQTRNGGPLDGLTGESELPCTVLLGAMPVELTVFASVTVELSLITETCEEMGLGTIQGGSSFAAPSNPGAVYAYRDAAGALLGWFRVPDNDGQPWTEEVP